MPRKRKKLPKSTAKKVLNEKTYQLHEVLQRLKGNTDKEYQYFAQKGVILDLAEGNFDVNLKCKTSGEENVATLIMDYFLGGGSEDDKLKECWLDYLAGSEKGKLQINFEPVLTRFVTAYAADESSRLGQLYIRLFQSGGIFAEQLKVETRVRLSPVINRKFCVDQFKAKYFKQKKCISLYSLMVCSVMGNNVLIGSVKKAMSDYGKLRLSLLQLGISVSFT